MPESSTAHRGFFPVVTGDHVTVKQAGATLVMSGSETHVTQGGAQVILAGGDATIRQGGAHLLGAGGNVGITQGGVVVAAGRSIEARNSYVAIALAPTVTVSENSRILLGSREAALVGLVAAAGCWVFGRLLGRSR